VRLSGRNSACFFRLAQCRTHRKLDSLADKSTTYYYSHSEAIQSPCPESAWRNSLIPSDCFCSDWSFHPLSLPTFNSNRSKTATHQRRHPGSNCVGKISENTYCKHEIGWPDCVLGQGGPERAIGDITPEQQRYAEAIQIRGEARKATHGLLDELEYNKLQFKSTIHRRSGKLIKGPRHSRGETICPLTVGSMDIFR